MEVPQGCSWHSAPPTTTLWQKKGHVIISSFDQILDERYGVCQSLCDVPHERREHAVAETSDAFSAGLGRPSRGRYGSDLMVEVLRELGMRYIALNPGASYRGLHDSL